MRFGIRYISTAPAVMEVWDSREKAGEIKITPSEGWAEGSTELSITGIEPLFLLYRGEGTARLLDIFFQ